MKAINQNDLQWHTQTLYRVFKIIQSCETLEQYDVSVKMLENYTSKYTHTNKKLVDMLNDIKEYCSVMGEKLKQDFEHYYREGELTAYPPDEIISGRTSEG